MQHIKINLNSYVYLEMEERDFKNWKQHYDAVLPDHLKSDIDTYRERVDKETGLVRMQIHEFMSVFSSGESFCGGWLPCKGNMIFDLKDMTAIP